MAFITLAGTLLDPNGDLAVGDQIRFTHNSTTGETVKSAVSVITIDPSGTYSLPLQYGLVLVEYKDVRNHQFNNLGVATVNQDNPATSIPELLNALVPVSSAELIEFQVILADCVTAQTASANSATASANSATASANSASSFVQDIINDLSQTYTFATVAAFKASVIDFSLGKVIEVTEFATGKEGGAKYIIVASSALPAIFQGVTASGNVFEVLSDVISPSQVGYNLNANDMVDATVVNANWQIMKDYIDALSVTNKTAPSYTKKLTMASVNANWVSGTFTPIGFYSDSTTDGFRTTGHVPSTGSDALPFSVTVNESPNAYPSLLSQQVTGSSPAKVNVDIYNGGFDSESYRSGFGLLHWYNVWFRGLAGSNVNWSDVKMIVLGFGTSDSANEDDTATVIANYSLDVECSIIDCLLRGVTPVLQQPVLTVQKFGNTGGDKRDGDQTITIINAVQDELAKKYGLEQLSYSEPFQSALDGFKSMQYGDLISPSVNDQVHPLDMGHRVMAGYLLKEFNKQVVQVGDEAVNIFAGSPNYIVENEATNITDTVLTRCITEHAGNVERLGEYFYKFPTSTANEHLLTVYVYCEKPTMLRYLPIKSDVEQPVILVASLTEDGNGTKSSALFTQPAVLTYTKSRHVMHLPFGLNQIQIKANAAGGIQYVGGLQLVPTALIDNVSFYRQSVASTIYNSFHFKFRDNTIASFDATDLNNLEPSWAQYSPADNAYHAISFTLSADFAAATDYEVRSHYNDLTIKGGCYNRFVFNSDTVSIYYVLDGASTLVDTITDVDIGAAMVAGNVIQIRLRTRFYNLSDTNIQIWSNGVSLNEGIAPVGHLWTSGYGLEMTNILCSNVSFQSIETLSGFNTNIA